MWSEDGAAPANGRPEPGKLANPIDEMLIKMCTSARLEREGVEFELTDVSSVPSDLQRGGWRLFVER